MNYFRSLEPTPSALTRGRVVMAIVGTILAVLVLIVVTSGEPADGGMIATAAATGVILIGDGFAYIGQPSLTRYRVGLVISSVGIVAAFATLLIPAPPA